MDHINKEPTIRLTNLTSVPTCEWRRFYTNWSLDWSWDTDFNFYFCKSWLPRKLVVDIKSAAPYRPLFRSRPFQRGSRGTFFVHFFICHSAHPSNKKFNNPRTWYHNATTTTEERREDKFIIFWLVDCKECFLNLWIPACFISQQYVNDTTLCLLYTIYNRNKMFLSKREIQTKEKDRHKYDNKMNI